ncbi:DNA polymerase zeta catalytic subunit like protein [Aduncisulcus paluster]|uniref:DNA polymerase zeta catalytic subunit like protein n=1 Tax=Aduncisulcus paluster TaxID=2918883 RepID=A0ABQ5KH71_9EUKA|nr:DNA polymerase zeta catalytic subunit like protein [Aduncisulcus paluster]
MIRFKLVTYDTYNANNIDIINVFPQKTIKSTVSKKSPIIRTFGRVEILHPESNRLISSCKACIHIHGLFPYLYLPIPKQVSNVEILSRFLLRLRRDIEVTMSQKLPFMPTPFHHHISLSRSINVYGFHSSPTLLVRISLFYESHVKILADIARNGGLCSCILRPFDAHLPYRLNFLVDYDINPLKYTSVQTGGFCIRRAYLDGTSIVNKKVSWSGKDKIIDSHQMKMCCFGRNEMPSDVNGSSSRIPMEGEIEKVAASQLPKIDTDRKQSLLSEQTFQTPKPANSATILASSSAEIHPLFPITPNFASQSIFRQSIFRQSTILDKSANPLSSSPLSSSPLSPFSSPFSSASSPSSFSLNEPYSPFFVPLSPFRPFSTLPLEIDIHSNPLSSSPLSSSPLSPFSSPFSSASSPSSFSLNEPYSPFFVPLSPFRPFSTLPLEIDIHCFYIIGTGQKYTSEKLLPLSLQLLPNLAREDPSSGLKKGEDVEKKRKQEEKYFNLKYITKCIPGWSHGRCMGKNDICELKTLREVRNSVEKVKSHGAYEWLEEYDGESIDKLKFNKGKRVRNGIIEANNPFHFGRQTRIEKDKGQKKEKGLNVDHSFPEDSDLIRGIPSKGEMRKREAQVRDKIFNIHEKERERIIHPIRKEEERGEKEKEEERGEKEGMELKQTVKLHKKNSITSSSSSFSFSSNSNNNSEHCTLSMLDWLQGNEEEEKGNKEKEEKEEENEEEKEVEAMIEIEIEESHKSKGGEEEKEEEEERNYEVPKNLNVKSTPQKLVDPESLQSSLNMSGTMELCGKKGKGWKYLKDQRC